MGKIIGDLGIAEQPDMSIGYEVESGIWDKSHYGVGVASVTAEQQTQTVGSGGGNGKVRKKFKDTKFGSAFGSAFGGDSPFAKGGAGWNAMGNIASGVDSVIATGHGFDDQGEWGQAANGIFDKASDTLMKIPGCEQYGAAIKMADLAGDLSAKMGLTNDGQTGIDQISQNGVGNLVVGTLLGNNLVTKKTSKFGADEETLENVGGSYGGTANDIYAAADKADKTYGWMSSHNRKKAQRAIDTARQQQNKMAAISKQNEQMHQMVDMMGGVAADAYRTQLMGGYDQSAMHVERGGRLEGKDYVDGEPVVYEVEDPTGPAVVEIVIEQYDPSVPCPVMEMPEECMEGMLPCDVEILPGDVSDSLLGARFPGCRRDEPGQECPVDQIREKVVRDFMPRVEELVEDVASDTMQSVMQKVQEAAGIGQPAPGNVGEELLGMFLQGVAGDVREGASCPFGMQDMVRQFVDWAVGAPGRMMQKGGSTGFSYSAGSSSSSVTRNIPGVGPVTVTRQSTMRPQVNVWAKGGKAVERQLDAPEVEESMQKNLIPEGALHRQRHHMDMGDDVTKKGIPVMDIKEDNGQEAEIERNEIIFNKEVTEKLEELYAVYYDGQSTEEERDQAAIDAGKLLTREIMLNTDDRTGLIDTLKRGGRVKDDGKPKYAGRSIEELVEYANEQNPRFIQRLNDYPALVGFDTDSGVQYGSHLLSYVTNEDGTVARVYPLIMEEDESGDGDGCLRLYGDEEALDEAVRRGDYIDMTPEEAELFTTGYKEKYKDFFGRFDEMEKYMRKHPGADPVMVRKMFMRSSDIKMRSKRRK